jgi:hypothetical protein
LAAINQTLLHLQENPTPHSSIVVHCDSHAAIQSLQATKKDPTDQQSSDILDLAQKLKATQNLSLTLHWIPSHIGIPGNEQVDALVKQALSYSQISTSLPPTLGQVKSSIRRYLKLRTTAHFKKRAEEVVTPNSHGIQYAQYLALNPSLRPQLGFSYPPSVSRTLNRLRLDTDSWCYTHSHPNRCSYCQDLFSPSHYLLFCPVTRSAEFSEQLTTEEHSLSSEEQAILILKRLDSNPFGTSWTKKIQKHPLQVTCAHPEHGTIPNTAISIPNGL